MTRQKLAILSFGAGLLLLFVIALSVANDLSPQIITPTEAAGGIIGTGVDELRCPINLTGIGSTWNGFTVGLSTIQDISEYFDQEAVFVTPYPPHAGDYAPNYAFGNHDFGTVYVCVVNNTIEAMLIDRHAISNSALPSSLAHWVSFLGTPALVSWHQSVHMRVLHWSRPGVSVSILLSEHTLYTDVDSATLGDAEWVYLYPFRGDNYEDLWPVSSRWLVQPFPVERPDIALNTINFEAVELTATALDFPWPSATPRATSAL